MAISHPKRFFAWLILGLPLAAAAQWVPTNGPAGPAVRRLATDGISLFASTGEYPILQSKDRGATWRYTGSDAPATYFARDMVARGDTLYNADGHGVSIHPGEGSVWRRANTGLGTDTSLGAIAFGWGGLLVVTDSVKVYQSLDQGGHWTRMDSGNAAQRAGWISLGQRGSVLAMDGDCAYIAGAAGIRLSKDRGRTWSSSWPEPKDTSVLAVLAQPPLVFAMTELEVYRSRDSGASWVRLSVAGAGDSGGFTSLAGFGSRLFAERYPGGLFSSSDAGESWSRDSGSPDLQGNLMEGGLVGIGDDLFAGSSDGVYRSSDFGRTWSGENAGIGIIGTRNLAAAGPGRLVAICSYRSYGSGDQGRHWHLLPSPNPSSIAGAGGILFCISTEPALYRSDDGGTVWRRLYTASELGSPVSRTSFVKLGPDLFLTGSMPDGTFLKLLSPPRAGQPPPPDPPPLVPNGMALCAGVPYAIVRDSLLRYDAGGRVWMPVPSRPFSGLAILASQGSAVLIGTAGKAIWRSADSGATWLKVADSSAFGRIHALLEVGQSVFAATDSGVAVSRNDGAWSAMNQGFETDLPSAHGFGTMDGLDLKIVTALAAEDGFLYATRDTGVWRIPVDSTGSGFVPRPRETGKRPARWTLLSGSVGFNGIPGEAIRDARGRSLGKAPSAANPHP
ncbi:MAG: hypothetical protein JF616_03215 [Fibrobacteres bacterium]|nr:hypothetical protein [Fibrobacterota bacterium]